MKGWKTILSILLAPLVVAAGYGVALTRRGFGTRESPSEFEKFAARTALKMAN